MQMLKRSLYFLLCLLLAGAAAISIERAAARARAGAAMAESANRFLGALTGEQRAKAEFKFEDEERFNFFFVPRARRGVTIKEMNAEQRRLAMELLRTGLSQRGYLKATTIIDLENVLREIEQGRGPVRDPEMYYISIFGRPAAKERWGWRFEGHHLSLNFTVVNGTLVATAPAFMGVNPAEVRQGPRQGLRALAAEEDLARALITALDEKQRAEVIFDQTALKDIVTFNASKAEPLSPAGLPASRMNAAQTAMLRRLIDEYLNRMTEELARERFEKLRRGGLDQIHFAWAGGIKRGDPHYYRVQGPSFLIEYDNTQNDANHIHSVWRDFNGDFGRDLLREHYQTSSHKP